MQFVIDLLKAQNSGHWVTVKKEGPLHGRHLFIDGDGQVTKGKGIPAHVLHHLNSKAGANHLKGAEPHEPDPLLRAKNAAADHSSFGAWQTHMMHNDREAFDAMSEHARKTNTPRPQLFDHFKPKEPPKPVEPQKQTEPKAAPAPAEEPEEHDDDLKRAKAEAPNHASHEDWVDHLNKHDGKAYNALSWHDSKPAYLFNKWGGGSKAQDKPKSKPQKPNHPTPKAHPEHVEKALQAHEKTIRSDSTETGTLHDPETADKIWGDNQGNAAEVDLSDALRKGLIKGNILTHNHPQGNSFSNEDIRFMLAHGLKEMRAVSKKHLHRVQAPEGYKNTEDNFANMQGKIKGIEDDLRSEMWDKVNSGELTPDTAGALHFHELWTRAAKQLGFKYERSEHND